jgi:membrane fusion protein (multidrug efflux system)
MTDRADGAVRSDTSHSSDQDRADYRQSYADAPTREREGDGQRGEPRTGSRGAENEQNDSSDGDQPTRTRWPLIALAILVVVALIGATIYWFATKDQETTDDAYTDGRAVMMAAHVSGYVTQLAINDNQFVHKGDLLLRIEQKDYIAARDQAASQLAAMQAQLDSARVALDKARITYPAQLAQAQAQLEQARGQLFQAEREYRRQHNVDRAATSQQTVDTSTANFQIAQGQVDQATAQLHQAELVDQNIAQAEAQVKQLEGQVGQAKANLDQAEINLGYTSITAPQDGWITKRNVEMGNFVQAGAQIFSLVTPDVWVTANFKETQLTRMRPGQTVRLTVDAYPQLRLEGHVDSIQLGSGAKFTAFPPENATGNFVKIVQRVPVKIIIDRGLDPAIPLPLGISVGPTVLLK